MKIRIIVNSMGLNGERQWYTLCELIRFGGELFWLPEKTTESLDDLPELNIIDTDRRWTERKKEFSWAALLEFQEGDLCKFEQYL